jgi:hypothetical protein
MNDELTYLIAHYSPAQIYFFLSLKIGLLLFAIYGVWQLRKVQRKLEDEENVK